MKNSLCCDWQQDCPENKLGIECKLENYDSDFQHFDLNPLKVVTVFPVCHICSAFLTQSNCTSKILAIAVFISDVIKKLSQTPLYSL